MTAVDRYVEEIKKRVFASKAELDRFEADLRAHFEHGQGGDESVAAVIGRLGTPEEVAGSFMDNVTLQYAGFFERLFAFVGDVGACFSLAAPVLAVGALIGPRLDSLEGPVAPLALALIAGMGLGLVGMLLFYFPVLESRFGRTAGKALMKIRVRSETGAEIGLGTAFLRRLSLYFEILVLDSLFIPFTAKRQRAFDIVAKTVVVKELNGSRGLGRYLACLALWLPFVLIFAGLALAFGASNA